MNIEPIVLRDDGLRVERHGTIGQYTFTCINNPEHIAEVIAVKRQRAIIQENNFRRWS